MVGSLELCDVKSRGVAMTSVTVYVYSILHGADMQECFHACATCTLRLCELVGHRLSFHTFGNSFCPRVARVRELFVNALVLQMCCTPSACFVFFFVCVSLCLRVRFLLAWVFLDCSIFPMVCPVLNACFCFAWVFVCVCLRAAVCG